MTAAEQHEALTLFPVYYTLVEHLRPGHDARTTDPGDLVGAIAMRTPLQTACLLVAHCEHLVTRIAPAAKLVAEVRAMCEQGRRPRYLTEMGYTLFDARGGLGDAC